ncbi:MAG: cytochrome b/b6 domain-containing protein, partial [Cellvibrionaceae bacterium]|nr:cytochrome b/b6 domain-containing protein [Cellvibrionaceae bacterium]
MILYNTVKRWGLVSQFFHWVIAFLILLAIILGLVADGLPLSSEKLKVFIYHKSIGITVLVLASLRLLWKIFSPQPQLAAGIHAQDRWKIVFGHSILYVLMLALPLSGWLLNSAASFPFQWMNLFSVPAIPGIPASWQDPFVILHGVLAIGFGVVVAGHIALAYYHHRHQSDVLLRMLPNSCRPFWFCLGFMGTTLVLFIGVQSFSQHKTDYVATEAAPTLPDGASLADKSHTHKQWTVIPDRSRLAFVGHYDGVEFTGEFTDFSASMYFDTAMPEKGFFDVVIDTASVTTFNADWDSTLPGEQWFFVADYPMAQYQT